MRRGLPTGRVTGFSAGLKGDILRLYATVQCSMVDGKLAGGVFRIDRTAATPWQKLHGRRAERPDQAHGPLGPRRISQYRFIATTDEDPNRVYVYSSGTSYWPPNHSTVYRSDDGGRTWSAVLFSDPRFATPQALQRGRRLRHPAMGASASSAALQHGRLRRRSRRGRDVRLPGACGPTTAAAAAGLPHRPAREGDKGARRGVQRAGCDHDLELRDRPAQPTRHYICYTDIGLA